MYTKEQQKFLLNLAREAIKTYLENNKLPEIDEKNLDKKFLEKRGAFVTLTINGGLHGCIGHILPIQSLHKDIIENAISAAFDDPRFYPLKKDEFDKMKIEISVLSLPTKLTYKNADDLLKKLTPKDGVIIKKGWNQATYLPQVWEDLKDKKVFLSSLCMKAGLDSNEWEKGDLDIETYTVEKFEEE